VLGAASEKNHGEKQMINITNIVPIGTTVPFEQHNGNIGYWVESLIETNGFDINRGKGVDIPQLNKEVKTKSNESKSPNSIATMTVHGIMNLPYSQSVVCQKMQNHYLVEYSNVHRVVTNEDNFDFSNPAIQSLIEDAYEKGRKEITENWKDGFVAPYVRGTEYGQFEKVPNQDSYRFRIPVKSMKSLKGMVKSSSQFDKFFEIH
jgi:hypothetical protein